MRSLLGWLAAAVLGAATPILTASLIRATVRGQSPALSLDVGFGAFHISLAPVLGGLFLLALIVERLGLRPSPLSCAILAPILAWAGIAGFFWFAYDVAPSFSMDAEEALILSSIAVSAGGFAIVRAFVLTLMERRQASTTEEPDPLC